jgi:hypothetical protein
VAPRELTADACIKIHIGGFAERIDATSGKHDRHQKKLALKPGFDYPICFFAAQRLG